MNFEDQVLYKLGCIEATLKQLADHDKERKEEIIENRDRIEKIEKWQTRTAAKGGILMSVFGVIGGFLALPFKDLLENIF